MNVNFIIISFQTIGGAGQISTANGGTIPINDIRGTLLAKVNKSNKNFLSINRSYISRKNDHFNKKKLLFIGLEGMAYTKQEKLTRCKLAAVYRLIDMYGWTQGIYNHVTVSRESHFLVF